MYDILICPSSGQSLKLLDTDGVKSLNNDIENLKLRTSIGYLVKDPIESALVREDGKLIYPIRRGVPVLKTESAFNFGIEKSEQNTIKTKAPNLNKMISELDFWYGYINERKIVPNTYVTECFENYFGFTEDKTIGKRVIDVGCGPVGTIDWMKGSRLKVGLDPLALAYRQLGTGAHQMEYIDAYAENIPLQSASFDIVSCLNALDHVDYIEPVINELMRIIAPGGFLVLVTDIHEEPTVHEPTVLRWDICSKFENLELIREEHLEKKLTGVYDSLLAQEKFDHSNPTKRYGMVAALFKKGGNLQTSANTLPHCNTRRSDQIKINTDLELKAAINTLPVYLRRCISRSLLSMLRSVSGDQTQKLDLGSHMKIALCNEFPELRESEEKLSYALYEHSNMYSVLVHIIVNQLLNRTTKICSPDELKPNEVASQKMFSWLQEIFGENLVLG